MKHLVILYVLFLFRLSDRLVCRYRGHDPRCTTTLNIPSNTDHHVHVCKRCDRVTKDETNPISDDLLDFALAMTRPVEGLPVIQQQKYMH